MSDTVRYEDLQYATAAEITAALRGPGAPAPAGPLLSRVTVEGPSPFGFRRVSIPGGLVTASIGIEARLYRHGHAHPHGPFGGCTWVPLGDCRPEWGCGWIASRAQWSVALSGPRTGTVAARYYYQLPAAIGAARAWVAAWNRPY